MSKKLKETKTYIFYETENNYVILTKATGHNAIYNKNFIKIIKLLHGGI